METTLDIAGRIVPTDDRPVIRAGFIGCGSHAFRNVYPTLQFTPVELVATCDIESERAEAYATQFGADESYEDHQTMLRDEALDAVFIVLNYDDDGRPRYPDVAIDCMRAGCDVWIEKPPAASTDTVREMMAVETETDQFVHVGYKKIYNPAVEKAKAIIEDDEFGETDTILVRYPESLPDRDAPDETLTHGPALIGLLDHLVHPGSLISYLGGPMERVTVTPSGGQGGFITIEFASGALGTIHMAAGTSRSSPLERVEIVGDGANVVVENGNELTYYRPYVPGPYGRTPTYMDGEGAGPVHWKPEFSLGQLYNKNLFLLGYYGEITDFAESCMADERPEKGGLEMSLELLKLYEAVLEGENRTIEL